ncbi:type III secretion system needle filament protein MxiH, partial [Shigella sonnei]
MSVTVPNDDWTLSSLSETFDDGTQTLQGELTLALDKLAKNPSNPQLLAEYQSK